MKKILGLLILLSLLFTMGCMTDEKLLHAASWEEIVKFRHGSFVSEDPFVVQLFLSLTQKTTPDQARIDVYMFIRTKTKIFPDIEIGDMKVLPDTRYNGPWGEMVHTMWSTIGRPSGVLWNAVGYIPCTHNQIREHIFKELLTQKRLTLKVNGKKRIFTPVCKIAIMEEPYLLLRAVLGFDSDPQLEVEQIKLTPELEEQLNHEYEEKSELEKLFREVRAALDSREKEEYLQFIQIAREYNYLYALVKVGKIKKISTVDEARRYIAELHLKVLGRNLEDDAPKKNTPANRDKIK